MDQKLIIWNNMEIYEIRGIYPNSTKFRSVVCVEDQRDAIAIAQGLRKVTTIKVVAVYDIIDGHMVFYDKLKVNALTT